MPVFRFHRGSLDDSMKTCFVAESKEDLFYKICSFNKLTNAPYKPEDRVCISSNLNSVDQLRIDPYIFDDRIGWNTHIVLAHPRCVTQDAYIIGFLSDSFYIEDEE